MVKHSNTYSLCKRLMDANKTEGLQDRIDLYEAANRFLEGEYKELTAMLEGKKKQ